VGYAIERGSVRLICAHTLPEPNASTRVLTKVGFQKTSETVEPEEGPVWRWERPAG
jgi:[ribosomal protein S5]-alanine N-acetyltransferase